MRSRPVCPGFGGRGLPDLDSCAVQAGSGRQGGAGSVGQAGSGRQGRAGQAGEPGRPSLRKVLIATRGEIAVRVVRACRDAGLASVAVYAEPDLDALHVQMADEAYSLSGTTGPETYLDIDKIIKVALESGADAVHPGYGFLAENADFARAVTRAGLTWIGPPPEAREGLAATPGNVGVISARDCSLQRRHQKLVEEAPAPFLGSEQVEALYEASKAILRLAGYAGAGTCEFLVAQDGTISFLEVNTRLQVEHPVSEEVTGIDLVREMFRIADGEPLGYDDPPARGHSIEFRINAEDPARSFLPAPGPITVFRPPSLPGVRRASGAAAGMTVPQVFDSLIAKLIVTGASRAEALQRAARALGEFEVGGMPTVLPFHRAVVTDPAFAAPGGSLRIHTRWIETEFTAPMPAQEPAETAEAADREAITVEAGGKRVSVRVPAALSQARRAPPAPMSAERVRRASPTLPPGPARSRDTLVSPMPG